ncbi:MAG: hypothetical protein ACOYK9_01330 [Chlamydiia bacterium]
MLTSVQNFLCKSFPAPIEDCKKQTLNLFQNFRTQLHALPLCSPSLMGRIKKVQTTRIDLGCLAYFEEISNGILKEAEQVRLPHLKRQDSFALYSVLGRSQCIKLPETLDTKAIEVVHKFMEDRFRISIADKKNTARDAEFLLNNISKWRQFHNRACKNLNYTYFNASPTIRARQYLEIANYLKMGICLAQKAPSQKREELLSTLPAVISEDINACHDGLLSRIHHSILPLCAQKTAIFTLPVFPLSIIHTAKEEAARRTLGEIVRDEPIGQPDAHIRNAFYQAENDREGLGRTREELLKEESHAASFREERSARGYPDYGPILERRKGEYLHPNRLIQDLIIEYKKLAPDQQDQLIEELIHYQTWHLPILEKIYDFLVESSMKLPQHGKNERIELKARLEKILRNISIYTSLSKISDKKTFVQQASLNILRGLLFDESSGDLSHFGAALILQTSGIFHLEKGNTLTSQFLSQLKYEEKLKNALREALRDKKINRSQVPSTLSRTQESKPKFSITETSKTDLRQYPGILEIIAISAGIFLYSCCLLTTVTTFKLAELVAIEIFPSTAVFLRAKGVMGLSYDFIKVYLGYKLAIKIAGRIESYQNPQESPIAAY